MTVKYVRIYYGPCESFHTTSFKPQRVRGLRDRLQRLGYRVDLIPVDFINYCMVEMCGYEVFRCNIQNLRFNTPHELDPVCQRAIDAVLDSYNKFKHARCYLWLWKYLEQQMFWKNEYAPKEHFPFDLEFKPLSTCTKCTGCCRILTTRNDIK